MPKTVSVVMPCLNEAATIGLCVKKAKSALSRNNLSGEVIVADNGSDDGSQEIARAAGATVVNVKERGYGRAYLGGLKAARGDYLIIADSDNTYDLSELDKFINKLEEGFDFVNGNRFGNIWSLKSLPVIHRYLGAMMLSSLLNLFFRTGLADAHCGMRAFTKEAFEKMKLNCSGMEFASEMLIKAKKLNLKTGEVRIAYEPRSQGSKLNPIEDGLRHLKIILRLYLQGVN